MSTPVSVQTVILDLRGEVCPYTFLRTRLALEEIQEPTQLHILLDHPPAFVSVPRALEAEGFPVLGIEAQPDGTCLVITAKPSRASQASLDLGGEGSL